MPLYVYLMGLFTLGATYLPLLLREETLDAFAREDGIFESLSALYFLGSGVLFLVTWVRDNKRPRPRAHRGLRALSYLGLALLLFVCAGEEISWGQRILGFESPEAVRAINVQGEVTLHNLAIFQGEESLLPVTPAQVFIGFTLAFGLLVPLLSRVSVPARNLFGAIAPIVPLPIGALFGANYLFQKLILVLLLRVPDLYLHPSMEVSQAVHEIREHGYALVWLLAAGYTMLSTHKPPD